MIEIERLSDALGARIHGGDLGGDLSDEVFGEIHQALVDHRVISFPAQSLTPDQHVAFSKRFGPCDVHSNNQYLLEGHPEILILSNDLKDGKPIGVVDAGVEWHSDLSWQLDPPLGSILYNLKNPSEGGHTGFIDMGKVYRALDADLKVLIRGLHGLHCVSKLVNPRVTISENRLNARDFYAEQLKKHPPVRHPLVYRHPDTGEDILFASPRFTIGIEELEDAVGQPLLDRLFAYLDDPQFQLTYQWNQHDVVMWDNRSVLHCALGGYQYPDIRLINRTTVLCDEQSRLQPVH